MEPATVPLTGDRWTPFVHVIEYQGDDLNGSVVQMQIRLAYDTPGSPLANIFGLQVSSTVEGLHLLYGGTATVAAHIAAGRIGEVPDGMEATDSLALSLLQIRIDELTMEALPFPAERGDDAVLYYDLQITPSGGDKQVWFRGPFIVRAGATQ